MEINITPDEVNKYIKDAILESTIGKTISVSIEKELKGMFDSYRSPIKNFINEQLNELVKEYMQKQDVKPALIAAIEKHLNPEVVSLIVSNGVYELNKAIKDRD